LNDSVNLLTKKKKLQALLLNSLFSGPRFLSGLS
jgi:hypothetical protein